MTAPIRMMQAAASTVSAFIFFCSINFVYAKNLIADIDTSTCASGHPNYSKEFFRITTEAWPLYSWTEKPFDPRLPTAIFFNGGPGQSSHGSTWDINGWNIIFWDQRGVACSKPLPTQSYYEQKNYSIEGTAKDAARILDLYHVKKASLYGVSYGTAPASVFAHLYPERTRVLILEGTLSDGSLKLHNLAHPQKLLLTFYSNLTEEKKAALQGLNSLPKITQTWFSKTGYYFLSLNDGLDKFSTFFDRIIELNINGRYFDPSFFNNFGAREWEDDPLGFGTVTFAAIACGELSQGVSGSTSGLAFSGNKLIQIEDNETKKLCDKYQFIRQRDFLAARYPVQSKIIYFQGTDDGATEAPQAISHYRSAARGEAHLFLRVRGGHSPLLGEVTNNYPNDIHLQNKYRSYLSQALHGIPPLLTKEQGTSWRHISKLLKNRSRSIRK